jgi:Fe-S oxidoreductase
VSVRVFLEWATVVLAVAGVAVFAVRARAIWAVMRRARPVVRWDRWPERVGSVVEHVLGHRRMLRLKLSGVLHYFIFSGFVVLFLDIVETIGETFHPGFSIGPVLAPLVDIWVILVLAGIILALYNRLVIRPERFHGSDERDAYVILGLIAVIVIGIVIHDSFYPVLASQVLHVADPVARSHFLGYALFLLWRHLGWTTPTAAGVGYAVGYLMDIGAVLLFLAYLPYSKHFHIVLAVPNVFFRNLRPTGELVEGTPDDTIAVRSFEDFRWKDILDLFTCTECGRCQAVCPAHAAGQPLSPKMVILDLRDALVERLGAESGNDTRDQKPLAGGVVRQEALWACTTCGACQDACPVFIEHVPKIVGLRAALLEEGEVEASAQKVLVAWERQGNSFGQPARRRPEWAKALDFPVKDARKEPVDWLWFVGDFASFDPRVQELTRMVGRILHRAGIDFGILYEGEVNSGNDALRIGEYGLFETLAQKNLKALSTAQYQRIFTTDPHSLNALKNEYRKFGFERPVFHYTEAFLALIREGRLQAAPVPIRATYHDPCYLGRWNHITEAPRALLQALGVQLIEMPRHGEQSFCCGAGGGRIWMEETGMEERPANQRIKEALALPGVTHFVVACPKDVSMFSAAAVALGVQDRLRVVDVTEIMATALGLAEPMMEAVPAPG